jgi:hypothetical protein
LKQGDHQQGIKQRYTTGQCWATAIATLIKHQAAHIRSVNCWQQ